MSTIRCKMCGAQINAGEGVTTATCEYCGTQQTLSPTKDDSIKNLYSRASSLRYKCEFDKAEKIYEKIVEQDDSEAEAHWGIVLCKYGIEYVDDPKTGKKIPTCHRTLYEAVTSDPDYNAAVDYGDPAQQILYEQEARQIDRIQKDILSVVKNEKPFDVFICYKETGTDGKRTPDSVIANDIYYQLTQEGFKVFYAPITLEGKLGMEYEPYIFAALNTAKVMLVVGTKPEYFNAVWVRNEWSRYLKLMKADRSRLLIPCYRDMDAYDLPQEFAHLQAQDMSKIGFINDLVRGIKKVINKQSQQQAVKQTAQPVVQPAAQTVAQSAAVTPLLKRAFIFLEDGDWDSANEYCERVLDQDPENAQAYLGKLMASKRLNLEKDIGELPAAVDDDPNFRKAYRYGDSALKSRLDRYVKDIEAKKVYEKAMREISYDTSASSYDRAADILATIPGYKDSDKLVREYRDKAGDLKYKWTYGNAVELMNFSKYDEAIEHFEHIKDYRDSAEKIEECRKLRLEHYYNLAKGLIAAASYGAALDLLRKIPDYKDSSALITTVEQLNADLPKQRTYEKAVRALENGNYSKAASYFSDIKGYKDADIKAAECAQAAEEKAKKDIYATAIQMMNANRIWSYESAKKALEQIHDYRDAAEQIKRCDERIEAIKISEEQEAEKNRKTRSVAIIIIAIVLIATIVLIFVSQCHLGELIGDETETTIGIDCNAVSEIVDSETIIHIHSAESSAEWKSDSEEHWHVCADCGENFDEGEHAFGEWVVTVQATEKQEGQRYKECSVCGYKITETIPKTVHTHSWSASWSSDKTYHWHTCSGCSEQNSKAKHTYGSWTVTKEATTSSTGSRYRTCSVCGYKQTETIAKLQVQASFQGQTVTAGSFISFGSYEQDNNTSNGEEKIEWLVLKVEGDKALVISKYALDCQRYNTNLEDVTWETCSLREWLNEAFINAAFSVADQNRIISTTVTADKNPEHSTSPGNNTIDKIFLLSITEVNKYFSSDSARQCSATAYAGLQGGFFGNYTTTWWLRSPGYGSDCAAYVHNEGFVISNGDYVNNSGCAVRPALWIILD